MTVGVVVAHVAYQAVPGAVLYIDFFFAGSAYYITSLLLRDIDRHLDWFAKQPGLKPAMSGAGFHH